MVACGLVARDRILSGHCPMLDLRKLRQSAARGWDPRSCVAYFHNGGGRLRYRELDEPAWRGGALPALPGITVGTGWLYPADQQVFELARVRGSKAARREDDCVGGGSRRRNGRRAAHFRRVKGAAPTTLGVGAYASGSCVEQRSFRRAQSIRTAVSGTVRAQNCRKRADGTAGIRPRHAALRGR